MDSAKKPYEPPAIVDSGPLVKHDEFTVANGGGGHVSVPLSRAIAIALAYAIKDREPMLAGLIHPVGAQLAWRRLPAWVQDRFYAICGELGIGQRKRPAWTAGWRDVTMDDVRQQLFRLD